MYVLRKQGTGLYTVYNLDRWKGLRYQLPLVHLTLYWIHIKVILIDRLRADSWNVTVVTIQESV